MMKKCKTHVDSSGRDPVLPGITNPSTEMVQVATTVAPDGGYGWIVVMATFICGFISDGISFSYGVIVAEVLATAGGSNADTALLGALSFAMFSFIGPLAGILTNRYGCRFVCIMGGIVEASGFILSIVASNLVLLYITLGILVGVGGGMIWISAFVCVSNYFQRRKALATGIASAGSSIGQIVMGPIIRFLFDGYGFNGALLILSGIMLNCAVCGGLFRHLSIKPIPKNEYLTTSKLHDKRNEGIIATELRCINETRSVEESQHLVGNEDLKTETLNPCIKSKANERSPHNRATGEKRTFRSSLYWFRRATDLDLFTHIGFLIYTFSSVLYCVGQSIPLIFIPSLAISEGLDDTQSSLLLSICGVSTAVGKVFSGGLSHLMSKRLKNSDVILYAGFLILGGAATCLTHFCRNFPTLGIYAAFFGFCTSVGTSLCTILLVGILGNDRLAGALGWSFAISGVGYLIGPPLGGLLQDTSGTYTATFLLAGFSLLVSGAVILLLLGRRRQPATV